MDSRRLEGIMEKHTDLPGRLADCGFIDILTGFRMEPMVRGLQLTPGAPLRSPGTVRIPHFLLGDFEKLLSKVKDHALRTSEREFGIRHDGISYRCSLIASPGSSDHLRRPGVLEDLIDRSGWSIRRIGSIVPDIETLDIPLRVKSAVRDVAFQNGLVLVGGSVGSGKTTTASAILREWVSLSRESAITLEDPPEFPMEGSFEEGGIIQQVEVSHTTLADAMRFARRWSPRFIMVGEVRTPEAAAELLHIAISGPMVICTIHASDIVQCLASMIRYASGKMGADEARSMLASSLKLVLHQRMASGGVEVEMGRVYGDGHHTIRSRIETGSLGTLQEEFDRQKINMRKKGS